MLPTRPSPLATTLAATLLTGGLALAAAPAHAEPAACQGRVVTTGGDQGTDGDDVMVVGPGQRSVSTGAGDDLVCIRLGDDLRSSFFLGAGPGNDVVHNETTASDRSVSVSLDTGDDTFVGSDASRESVSTGADTWGGIRDVEKDVVDTRGGNDSVATGSVAPGTPNPDVIRTGTGDDAVIWAGEQVGAPLDLGTGDNQLRLLSGWAGSDVDIDAPAGRATADSRPVLRWSGDVASYSLQYTHLRTTFTGTDLDEYVTFWPAQADQQGPASTVADPQLRLDADMGGGDDRLEMLDAAGGSWVGGPGKDRLGMPRCQVADVRLGIDYSCNDETQARTPYAGAIDAWETVSASGGHIQVVGTNGRDTIRVRGRRAVVDGRGGRDVLTSSGSRTGKKASIPVVIRGGAGADRIRGGFSDERLIGGGGADVMRGGPGDDQLVGGAGRDRADGQGGRDRCSAEVRRNCESR